MNAAIDVADVRGQAAGGNHNLGNAVNAIGTHFIEMAKKNAEMHQRYLPDQDLAYFEEGAQYFGDYVRGVGWAQKFAARNREVMMTNLIATVPDLVAAARVEVTVLALTLG